MKMLMIDDNKYNNNNENNGIFSFVSKLEIVDLNASHVEIYISMQFYIIFIKQIDMLYNPVFCKSETIFRMISNGSVFLQSDIDSEIKNCNIKMCGSPSMGARKGKRLPILSNVTFNFRFMNTYFTPCSIHCSCVPLAVYISTFSTRLILENDLQQVNNVLHFERCL